MATTVDYTVSSVVLAGLDWAALSTHQTVGTVGPDTFANTGRELFYVKNTGAEMTVTFNSVAACSRGSDHDLVVTMPIGSGTATEKMIGPFSTDRFGTSVSVTLGRLTAVVCDVIKLPSV